MQLVSSYDCTAIAPALRPLRTSFFGVLKTPFANRLCEAGGWYLLVMMMVMISDTTALTGAFRREYSSIA
jgi:hypothetical protein